MSALASSARGASLLILLQVSTRALTFIVNQVLLRYVSPELLGLEAQLALYAITVIYFSRESIRVAVQREPNRTDAVVNMAYVSIILGIPLAFGLGSLYARASHQNVPFFLESVIIYAISCIIQLIAEPAFVVAQQKLEFGIRASAEGIGTLLKCFATCGFAIYAARIGRDTGVLPFAVGEFAFAVVRFFAYTAQIRSVTTKHNISLLPHRLRDVKAGHNFFGLFPQSLSKLSASLWIQDAFKYILTQGDSIVVTAMTSLADQGAYALAANYGGLAARMLFQPIEESSRNLFAKLCAHDASAKKPGLVDAQNLLQLILKLYSLIGLAAVAVGPPLAPTLLGVIAGSRWATTGAGDVLSAYCYYIPFLAINGITEGFVASVASSKELGSQSLSMGFFFAVFAGAAWFFLKYLGLGAVGLVYANCVNMGMRILYNIRFIRRYFKDHGQPFNFATITASTLSITTAVVARASLIALEPRVIGLGVVEKLVVLGAPATAFVLLTVFFERDFILGSIKRWS